LRFRAAAIHFLSNVCPDIQAFLFIWVDSFLRSTYASPYTEIKRVEHWTSILRLASKWTFTSLRELAVKHLFKITTPIEKIVLGHTFDLPQWLPIAYGELCERETPLSIEEGRQLSQLGEKGGDIVILLYQARHSIYGVPHLKVRDTNVKEVVEDVFELRVPTLVKEDQQHNILNDDDATCAAFPNSPSDLSREVERINMEPRQSFFGGSWSPPPTFGEPVAAPSPSSRSPFTSTWKTTGGKIKGRGKGGW
jgi:hypothetical protein